MGLAATDNLRELVEQSTEACLKRSIASAQTLMDDLDRTPWWNLSRRLRLNSQLHAHHAAAHRFHTDLAFARRMNGTGS